MFYEFVRVSSVSEINAQRRRNPTATQVQVLIKILRCGIRFTLQLHASDCCLSKVLFPRTIRWIVCTKSPVSLTQCFECCHSANPSLKSRYAPDPATEMKRYIVSLRVYVFTSLFPFQSGFSLSNVQEQSWSSLACFSLSSSDKFRAETFIMWREKNGLDCVLL